MGLVKTRRLAAMQKQQRAKANADFSQGVVGEWCPISLVQVDARGIGRS